MYNFCYTAQEVGAEELDDIFLELTTGHAHFGVENQNCPTALPQLRFPPPTGRHTASLLSADGSW